MQGGTDTVADGLSCRPVGRDVDQPQEAGSSFHESADGRTVSGTMMQSPVGRRLARSAGMEVRCHAALAKARAERAPHQGSEWPRGSRAGPHRGGRHGVHRGADGAAAAGCYARLSLRQMRAGLSGRVSLDDQTVLDVLLGELRPRPRHLAPSGSLGRSGGAMPGTTKRRGQSGACSKGSVGEELAGVALHKGNGKQGAATKPPVRLRDTQE